MKTTTKIRQLGKSACPFLSCLLESDNFQESLNGILCSSSITACGVAAVKEKRFIRIQRKTGGIDSAVRYSKVLSGIVIGPLMDAPMNC
jgi:hypothetical protein